MINTDLNLHIVAMDNPINVDEDYSNIEIYEIGFERKGVNNMDEIYQKIEQSDYDYLWITDPYIVKVIQNINENKPFPLLYIRLLIKIFLKRD